MIRILGRVFLTMSLLLAVDTARADLIAVAIAEGEIPGMEPRDKVVATLSVTSEENGGLQFSQCVTINGKVNSCEWLEKGLPYSMEMIQAVSKSIPNDTIRVFTDSSVQAAEARSFLRTNGDAFVQAIQSANTTGSATPVRLKAYNAHRIFPYILWRARTF